ncbi:helix-turn-helix domain-containing protein [Candidatus Peregrinibacteria bacterium]|nr:helix-turn-helix domain-containing protein [Candidatus Peregrinibacteria bacterium]
MEEKFFTTEQVANILQVHPFTILKFIREGKLKGIKLGRVYRIKESDIKNFLEERMTHSKGKKEQKEKKKEKESQGNKKKEKTDTTESFVLNKNKGKEDDHYYII